jgi:hypothetical protein
MAAAATQGFGPVDARAQREQARKQQETCVLATVALAVDFLSTSPALKTPKAVRPSATRVAVARWTVGPKATLASSAQVGARVTPNIMKGAGDHGSLPRLPLRSH